MKTWLKTAGYCPFDDAGANKLLEQRRGLKSSRNRTIPRKQKRREILFSPRFASPTVGLSTISKASVSLHSRLSAFPERTQGVLKRESPT